MLEPIVSDEVKNLFDLVFYSFMLGMIGLTLLTGMDKMTEDEVAMMNAEPQTAVVLDKEVRQSSIPGIINHYVTVNGDEYMISEAEWDTLEKGEEITFKEHNGIAELEDGK